MSQLQEECEAIWKNGRQICESISLTGHPYIFNNIQDELSISTAKKDKSFLIERCIFDTGYFQVFVV